MADKTGIQWAAWYDEQTKQFRQGGTLNIGGGCTKVSEECDNCYAMPVTAGLESKFNPVHGIPNIYTGLTRIQNGKAQWTNKVMPYPERLAPILRKGKGQAWFVSSLTDIFHPDFTDEYLAECFGMFAVADWHRFYVLTKREKRMADFSHDMKDRVFYWASVWIDRMQKENPGRFKNLRMPEKWPIPHIWYGASAGTQKRLEERLESIVQVNGEVVWLSLEPLLSRLYLFDTLMQYTPEQRRRIKWAVTGGESGVGARPMELEWALEIIRDCDRLGIAPFFKQKGEVLARALGCHDKKGGDPSEWPVGLDRREWPSTPPPSRLIYA